MMEYLGGKPKDTVIIGVEPKEIEWGLRLSPELEQKVSHIVEIVLKEVTEEITEEYGIC
jgi:Ni,Fe-hydrogenase maturation factor